MFGRIIDTLWKYFFWYCVPKRIKKDYKYVGYTLWWLEPKVTDLREEIDPDDYTRAYNAFKRGQLVAYEDLLRELKEDQF